MKVALVHDWLNGMRGGEKVLEVLTEIFPDAHIYTLLYEPDKISPAIKRLSIKTSFIQRLPGAFRYYRYYLPFFPFAVRRFNLDGYDLVLSVSHCAAKGVRTGRRTCHICYCLTPMRYVWDFGKVYFGRSHILLWPFLRGLKWWDRKTAEGPDAYITISENVANRVKTYYNKESTVVYPPVATDFFDPGRARVSSSGGGNKEGGYYLVVSALVPYKRIDIAVKAFNRLNLPLVVIGSGTEYVALKKLAGDNIKFLGWQSDETVRDYYAGCEALIFPGEEDFGITVLEAQSCGKPVIAFRAGGALETIDPALPSGVFFSDQTEESLAEAVLRFQKERRLFDSDKIRSNALRFGKERFKREIEHEIQRIRDIHDTGQGAG